MKRLIPLIVVLLAHTGCALVPEVAYEPQIHNPFPQLARVAILPFFNQSDDPTVNQDRVALAYYNELQKVPGFEVMPVGVVKQQLLAHRVQFNEATNYQDLAKLLGVDAIVVGTVTDYTPYYPPRMTMAVNWYAANPCFHPIPAGYGLPWGTAEEEFIPDPLLFEAEFALAREQLKTQTPTPPANDLLVEGITDDAGSAIVASDTDRPPWPDPRGFVPLPPTSNCPKCVPNHDPVITHVRTYNGHDNDFTAALANYYHFRDDARFGGWQAYLQRSDDFIRFCCHLHISEMLAARGGAGETRVARRWPIGRYDL